MNDGEHCGCERTEDPSLHRPTVADVVADLKPESTNGRELKIRGSAHLSCVISRSQ